jgi:hypothetical protein
MDLFANPVTLGGLAAFVALGAWAMGRLQGAAEYAAPARDSQAPQRHDQQTSLVPEAPGNPALADSLGELHAEISAFRRQERVLASLEAELLPLAIGSGDYAATNDPAGFALLPPLHASGRRGQLSAGASVLTLV